MGTDVTSRRTVEPFGLFFLNQHWYLAGRAPGEETVKNYRVNRIADAEVNAKQAGHAGLRDPGRLRPRASTPGRSRPGSWATATRPRPSSRFRAQTGAARPRPRLGEPVEGHPDRRRFRVRRRDAFARWLLSFAGDLVPVSPARPRWTTTAPSSARPSPITHRPSDRPSARPPA